ncbi:MAG TPA: hypothetical protein DC057_20075 [Spirochaetia bacterium]|nr:hypothetical protein [Spirochaetia bacterium]
MDDKEVRRAKYAMNPDNQIRHSKKYYKKHHKRILHERKLKRQFNNLLLKNAEKLLLADSQ